MIYSDRKIGGTHPFRYKVPDDEEKKEGIVIIIHQRELNFNSIEAMQIAHILHRNIMKKMGYVQFGRSHYIDPDKIHPLKINEYPY